MNTSVLGMTIRISGIDGNSIELKNAAGQVWRQQPTKLADELSAAKLWQRLKSNWSQRQGLLQEAGAEIGRWLFHEAAAEDLRRQIQNRKEGTPLLRIELRVPHEVAEFPWEIAALEGMPLAIHPALTVVRVSDRGAQQLEPVNGQILVHIIGVELVANQKWAPLAVAQEVETVRRAIESASRRGLFSVEIDAVGDWRKLEAKYSTLRPGGTTPIGPPQIFHFAGHGLPEGKGLVFRRAGGKSAVVTAEQLAHLFMEGRRVRLAFFNACNSSAAGRGQFQPFGGLAALLIQQGIPNVVGLQTPVFDSEAPALAQTFYSALARGDGIDCAIQEARKRLFRIGSDGVAWAFLNLHVSGEPEPLTSLPRVTASIDADEVLRSFGHEKQRTKLSRFISRKDPTVIVVHGEEKSGHRHVLDRLQVDLEQAGNVLWRPVAELRLNLIGEPLLRRSQLASGIARALALPDDGSQDALEGRIAEVMAERTADRVLVIDLVEEVTFHSRDQAQSFLALITELWGELMQRASTYRRTLPVYLLTAVAYPRLLPEGDRRARKTRKAHDLAVAVVAELQRTRRLKGNARLKILEQLEPFDELYVAEFLEDTLNFDPERAAAVATNLVGIHDNETILRNLRNFLEDLEG